MFRSKRLTNRTYGFADTLKKECIDFLTEIVSVCNFSRTQLSYFDFLLLGAMQVLTDGISDLTSETIYSQYETENKF